MQRLSSALFAFAFLGAASPVTPPPRGFFTSGVAEQLRIDPYGHLVNVDPHANLLEALEAMIGVYGTNAVRAAIKQTD